MECKAEISTFAIFLFCLLVPLGSLAPTETSESKVTTGQRQKRFTTDIQSLSAVLQDEAHDLFEFYNNCVSATFHSAHQTIRTKAKDMVERTLDCPAFHANCCVLHRVYNILNTLQIDIETICKESSRDIVMSNIIQLNTTLSRGASFYNCPGVQNPLQGQTMGLAERKNYLWWFLKRYEDIMQSAVDLYS